MLHKEKRKHSKEQWVSNFIASELVKTNKTIVFRKTTKLIKTMKSTRILHIILYAIFREASEIHIIELYLCDWFWLWSRYRLRVLSRFQAANESSLVTHCDYFYYYY